MEMMTVPANVDLNFLWIAPVAGFPAPCARNFFILLQCSFQGFGQDILQPPEQDQGIEIMIPIQNRLMVDAELMELIVGSGDDFRRGEAFCKSQPPK